MLIYYTLLLYLVGATEDSTAEEEYVFAIPRLGIIAESAPPQILLTTSSSNTVNIDVSISDGSFRNSRQIDQHNPTIVSLPSRVRMAPEDDTPQDKTVIIRSSEMISVFAIDNEGSNGDGFVAYPSSLLGTDYRIASYSPLQLWPSFFCISALFPNTSIRVKTMAGMESVILLKKYESYRFDGATFEDLSGTLVTSNEPISVVSGVYTQVSIGSPDYTAHVDGLLEQLPDVTKWGSKFFLGPFSTLSSGYKFRVFTRNIRTTLDISGESISISPESFYEGDVVGDTVTSIESDFPVMIAQYMKSSGADNLERGDPSMLIVPPATSFTNSAKFYVYQYTLIDHTYYINVMIECHNVNGLTLDNTLLTQTGNVKSTNDNLMCCVREQVSPGQHSISHTNQMVKFAVIVYAICDVDDCQSSYAYPANAYYSQGT